MVTNLYPTYSNEICLMLKKKYVADIRSEFYWQITIYHFEVQAMALYRTYVITRINTDLAYWWIYAFARPQIVTWQENISDESISNYLPYTLWDVFGNTYIKVTKLETRT